MKDKWEFRPRRWLAISVVALAFLVVGSFYLDDAARGWVASHQTAGQRSFMQAVSRYGDWPEHVALGLIMLAVAWSRANKSWMRIFAAMIVACAMAGIGARVVKIATGRARPHVQVESGWNGPRLSARHNAFPSGHTAASTAFFATLVFAGWRVGAPLLLIPGLIAFSRMSVAAHYLSDVVCGALIGLAVAYLVARWIRRPIANHKSQIEN